MSDRRGPMDSAGRPIKVGDSVAWRGQRYTIRGFGESVGRSDTRAIEFEEPLHVEDEVPDEIGVDLVQTSPAARCRRCGGDCRRWGEDTCPFKLRQIPREPKEAP
jgi:hypothetical protein